MELSRRSASASTSTSKHTTVNMFDVQDVGIFDNIEAHNLSVASEYLLALRNKDCKTRISYFNQAEIKVLPLIGTVLLKSMQSQYRVVSLLTSQRAYTILSEKNWRWGTISHTDLMGHTAITLALPNYEPNHVIVLRQFHGGADGQVCLALTKDFNLVVVKKFYYEKLCEKELNVWREVYGVGVFSTVLLDSHCLVMPFVFHCIKREGSVCFDFDLSNWGRVANSESPSDERFEAWTTKINGFILSSDIAAESVLNDSVEELARHCLVHGDLEWRHVALLPVLDDSGDDVIGMKPVLIDLASVEKVESESIALKRMQESKANLLSQLT